MNINWKTEYGILKKQKTVKKHKLYIYKLSNCIVYMYVTCDALNFNVR